ncbi:hypothetical protein IW262DRAFT_1281551 [Armillaria fumosa]|nr:hypothetical protein IW262DRAFT_1281551 [Armillaria fumosa]
MEDAGYIGIPNKEILQSMIASYRSRKQASTVTWINSQSKYHKSKEAKSLAMEGAARETQEPISLEIPPTLRITGATLSKMSQGRAYKAIHGINNEKLTHRKKTRENIKQAQQGALHSFGVKPTEAKLWKSLRHRDIDRNTTYLLWMAMHDAYRIGAKWLNFGLQYQERGYCSHCNNSLENMAHIMTSCESPGQKEVWELTKSLLEKRGIQWRPLSMANILSCAIPIFKTLNGGRDKGKERFYKIVVSSSIQVIWNARCERVIQNDNTSFSPVQIQNRWLKKVRKRLELDCLMTRSRFGKKALQKELVLQTWSGVIENEHRLPKDWTEIGGVLVGME